MKLVGMPKLTHVTLMVPLLMAVSAVFAEPSGKSPGHGKSASSERSRKEKDDKKRDGDETRKLEERLGKIGEMVPRGESDDEKVRELPPGLEALVSDDHLKNAPPAWGKWSRAERYHWIKEMEKHRSSLQKAAKTKKDFSANDLEASLKSLDSLAAAGVEPKDATSAVNGLIEKGYRGDELAGAFRGFTGGGAAKSASDGAGGLGDLLRGQLEDLLKGKGAVLIDILDDGKVNAPAPATPLPATPLPTASTPTGPAPADGDVPPVSPIKDSAPERAAKKGKMR